MSESADIEVDITLQEIPKKKRGRPKKIQDMKEYKREYNKKKYQENSDVAAKKIEYQKNRYKNDEEVREKVKETNKEYYEKNKDKLTDYQKQLHHKYKLALTILKKLIQNDKIPSEYKDEVTLICM